MNIFSLQKDESSLLSQVPISGNSSGYGSVANSLSTTSSNVSDDSNPPQNNNGTTSVPNSVNLPPPSTNNAVTAKPPGTPVSSVI